MPTGIGIDRRRELGLVQMAPAPLDVVTDADLRLRGHLERASLGAHQGVGIGGDVKGPPVPRRHCVEGWADALVVDPVEQGPLHAALVVGVRQCQVSVGDEYALKTTVQREVENGVKQQARPSLEPILDTRLELDGG